MTLFPPLEATPSEVREALAPLRNDFSVALYDCQNPFAVGAIIRVGHSFLVREIILVGEGSYYEKASMGMQKYETIVSLPGEEAFFEHVRGRPLWALEKDAAIGSIVDVAAFPEHVVLVLGSERTGIPAPVLARMDRVLAIPMYGVNHSLPVTVAAGIAMHEWARRHYAAPARPSPSP